MIRDNATSNVIYYQPLRNAKTWMYRERERERERERGRERERERETDRQTDRRETDEKKERQTDRHTMRENEYKGTRGDRFRYRAQKGRERQAVQTLLLF